MANPIQLQIKSSFELQVEEKSLTAFSEPTTTTFIHSFIGYPDPNEDACFQIRDLRFARCKMQNERCEMQYARCELQDEPNDYANDELQLQQQLSWLHSSGRRRCCCCWAITKFIIVNYVNWLRITIPMHADAANSQIAIASSSSITAIATATTLPTRVLRLAPNKTLAFKWFG